MQHTEYSWLTDDELLAMVLQKDELTPLEKELAARLELSAIAVDELAEEVSELQDELLVLGTRVFYTRR